MKTLFYKIIIAFIVIFILYKLINYLINKYENYKPIQNLTFYMNKNVDNLDKYYLCYYYNLNSDKERNPIDIKNTISESTQNELENICKQKNNLNLLEEIYNNSKNNKVNCNLPTAYGEWNSKNRKTRDTYFKWNKLVTNNDGCSTRDKVLARDSDDNNPIEYDTSVWNSPCTIKKGSWTIPTEDNRILTHSNDLDIDHHVPLKNAFNSGGCMWNNDKIAYIYANDMTPGHLKVISLQMNRSKGDKTPDQFIPYKYRTNKLNIRHQI